MEDGVTYSMKIDIEKLVRTPFVISNERSIACTTVLVTPTTCCKQWTISCIGCSQFYQKLRSLLKKMNEKVSAENVEWISIEKY